MTLTETCKNRKFNEEQFPMLSFNKDYSYEKISIEMQHKQFSFPLSIDKTKYEESKVTDILKKRYDKYIQNLIFDKYIELGILNSQKLNNSNFEYTSNVVDTIINTSNKLFISSLKRGNFVVLSKYLVSICLNDNRFEIDECEITGDIQKIGKIKDISVFINPNIEVYDTRILVGVIMDGNVPGVLFTESEHDIIIDFDLIKLDVSFSIDEIGFYPESNYYTYKFNEKNWTKNIHDN